MKTMAVKLDDELHALLTMLGQVMGKPVHTLMLEGVQAHVERLCRSSEVAGSADAMLAAINAEAEARRRAVNKMFSGEQSAVSGPKPKPVKAVPPQA